MSKSGAKDKIIPVANGLISIGKSFIPQMMSELNDSRTGNPGQYSQQFGRWVAECRTLILSLGRPAEHFQLTFQPHKNGEERLSLGTTMLGAMEALQSSLEKDLLGSTENILRAEVFSDLLEQAEHLLSEGYFLAAGVLARAVLEDHLRKWCDKLSISFAKPKPTISDFNAALGKDSRLSPSDTKHVTAMASIGNEAAHNLPTLTKQNVERLVSDVQRFLAQHPIP